MNLERKLLRGILPKEQETEAQEKEEAEDDEEEKRKKRDLKQEWLREAERCQLQGLPLPSREDMQKSSEEETNATDGQTAGTSKKGRLDSWLKSTTESFAWRFVAGLDASVRNVRVVIVQDGVEIGTIFHSMNIVPRTLDAINATEGDQQEDNTSTEASAADPSMATPPPDVVPEGEYDDGEHLDKIVKLQGFGVFVRLEEKRSKSPKTLRFSMSVSADDYILRPTEGNLTVAIFDPYPPGKQTKKKTPTIEEEPTTPTTATATVDSVTSSKSRRSKREKRSMIPDENQTETMTDTGTISVDSERPAKQLRSALKRPDRLSSSTRQFSISEAPTTLATPALRPKSHTVDLVGATSRGGHSKSRSTVSRGKLSRAVSTGERSRISYASAARSVPLLPMDDSSTVRPPSLDLHLSFGDVMTMFSSRHYKLMLLFQSTVERMKNGRPDKRIASCFGELGPDKKRSVYVDALTSAVKHVDDPAITSQLPPSALQSTSRLFGVERAQTAGGAPPQRVKLHLQLELPSLRDKNQKVIRSWWQYAYSAALYEVRQRRAEESFFDRKDLQFDWEKQKYKRKEYVDLYVVTRLERASVLRTMELKVKLGTKSPEEELLKIEDELPVEQIMLYRSIARSLRVRGIKTMPDSVLGLHDDQWLTASPARKKAGPNSSVASGASPSKGELDEMTDASCLMEVEADCTDINGIRREADAVRMRSSVTGDLRQRKANLKRLLHEDIGKNMANQRAQVFNKGSQTGLDRPSSSKGGPEQKEVVASTNRGDNSDGRTVRSFKTARTSAPKGVNDKDPSSSRLRISASITFSNVELMVYQENTNAADSTDSMRFRPANSVLPSSAMLNTKIRSGLQVVTNDASSSEVSDVSILSDDQLFFDQNDDTSSMPDGESVAEPFIMSSADFLMFGLPRDVVLHVMVSGLAGKIRGQSGGHQILSLAVDNVSISGDNDCHILSLKPTSADSSRPLDEVHVEKKKTPSKKRTAVSFTELEMFQEQAILVSVLSKQLGTQLQCDLSKTVVTCDLQAAVKIYEFFADVQVVFPQSLIAPTQTDVLRQYAVHRLATVKQGWNRVDDGVSSAIRLHGLDIAIPGPIDDDSLSRAAGSSPDAASSNNAGVEVKISLNLIEYYDGSLFEDILSLSNDFVEVGSRMTNEVPLSTSDMGWQRRNLKMMNVTKLVDGSHPSSSRHSVRQ